MKFYLLLALLWTAVASGQSVPQGLITAGTTTTVAGRQWLYVRWTSADGSLPFGTPFAIHLKNGGAAAAVPLVEQGVTLPAEEQSIVAAHLSRAAGLGTDTLGLATDASALYDSVRLNHQASDQNPALPADNAPTALKLARLIHQAKQGDARTAQSLNQMALAHSGVALAIGTAWAGPTSVGTGAAVTMELRTWDPVTCKETGIAGRVTITAGQPVVLSAPGAPIQVPDATATGDRVIKLRWATPIALRREAPLTAGHQLWRVSHTEAESRGWHLTTPSTATLSANPAVAKRINQAPIWLGKMFDEATAGNFSDLPPGDPLTLYFADDNERYALNPAGEPIGTAFADGSAFYYFVAVRDLLGRPGNVSAAGLGLACARRTPSVPAEVSLLDETVTTNGGSMQCFTLRWKANVAEGDNDTDEYVIYRGSAIDTPNVDLADPLTLPPPRATLPHAPDADGYMQWRDDALPQTTDGTRTYWYAIRAVHHSPCPPDNFSRLTPAVYGGLRSAAAPQNTVVSQSISCPVAGLSMATVGAPYTFDDLPPEAVEGELRTVRLVVTRLDRSVEWIGVRWNWGDHTETAYTHYEFEDDDDTINPEFQIPASAIATLTMISGSDAGSESRSSNSIVQPSQINDWNDNKILVLTGLAAAPSLGEIRVESSDHTRMFGLGPATTLNVTDLGGGCIIANTAAADHTPFVISALRSGVWSTVAGIEAMGGKLFCCDPAGLAQGYRAHPVLTGATACIHMADSVDGSIRPIRLRLRLPANSAEYRIFRRLDDGELQLFAQGDGSRLPGLATEDRDVLREDSSLPATATKLCYYGQTFNRAGIGGPLQPLGDCILLGRRDVPTPTLKPPRPSGTAAAPTMRLEWYCPTQGIERFRIQLDPVASGTPVPVISALKSVSRPPSFKAFRIRSVRKWLPHTLTVHTGLVGQDFAAGPVFTLDVPIRTTTAWRISITAISRAGIASKSSPVHPFLWTIPPTPVAPGPEPTVDWPARKLPPVGRWNPLLRAELTARNFHSPFGGWETWDLRSPGPSSDYPVGVRIASLRTQPVLDPWRITTREFPVASGRLVTSFDFRDYLNIVANYDSDPNRLLLRRAALDGSDGALVASVALQLDAQPPSTIPSRLVLSDAALLPAVLYRQQVASERFPEANGATVQVSPMLREIAWGVDGGDYSEIRDPFIGVVTRYGGNAPDSGGKWLDFFLLDTQPVVKGARYRYTLLRFDAGNGEILESIDAGEVLIPDTL